MTETKVVKSAEKFLGKPEIAEEAKPLFPPPPLPSRKEKAPMNYEYMNQMTAMMVTANLYNCSPGRSPEVSAKVACDAADALCKEWFSRQPEVSKRKK